MKSDPIELYQVDAFTNRPFAGNPAAICLLDAPREDAWLQALAMEMNLSETAYPILREDGDFDLRWFTPVYEVDLCGHATLAAAHTLWETGRVERGTEIRFHTRSGVLLAHPSGEWIELDFPAKNVVPAEPPAGLAEALGTEIVYSGSNGMDLFVEVADEATVRGLAPDMALLGQIETRGIGVTSAADEGTEFDFVSRFFAPRAGIPEDSVTGSAHCALTPYWAEKLGKAEMLAFQASPRGGVVRVRLKGDRVMLGGQAVTVLEGRLR